MRILHYGLLLALLAAALPAQAQTNSRVIETKQDRSQTTALPAQAQTDSSYTYTTVNNEVQAVNLANSQKKLNAFLQQNDLSPRSRNETSTKLSLTLELTGDQYQRYEKMLDELGFVSGRRLNVVNRSTTVRDLQLEIAYLQQKCDNYQELLQRTPREATGYLDLWNEKNKIEQQIFGKETELLRIDKTYSVYVVDLVVYDSNMPSRDTKIAFVNMPGFEYSYLWLNSPKEGLSASSYSGYFLKYLFTRGKSFAMVGVYRANGTVPDSSDTYYDLFCLNFGQDFYSKHFGHGRRKFFNLYSGYTVGGVLANAKSGKQAFFMHLTPAIGIELYKNDYLLIDSKAGYFIPLTAESLHLRGISANVSVNFVF